MPIPVWAFTGTATPRLSTLSKHLARDGFQLVVYEYTPLVTPLRREHDHEVTS
jgi:hypothetical protein